jgi:hypothetical protein
MEKGEEGEKIFMMITRTKRIVIASGICLR